MIKIKKNPNGDTRTAPKNVSFEDFQEANDMHISDVSDVMYELCRMIDNRGTNHDCTKKSQEKLFYDNFLSTMNKGTDFTKDEWYQIHIKAERHHLLSHCPDDVNLIDVLEMIVDCTCAGLARSGEVRPMEINDDILNDGNRYIPEFKIPEEEVIEKEEVYNTDEFGRWDSMDGGGVLSEEESLNIDGGSSEMDEEYYQNVQGGRVNLYVNDEDFPEQDEDIFNPRTTDLDYNAGRSFGYSNYIDLSGEGVYHDSSLEEYIVADGGHVINSYINPYKYLSRENFAIPDTFFEEPWIGNNKIPHLNTTDRIYGFNLYADLEWLNETISKVRQRCFNHERGLTIYDLGVENFKIPSNETYQDINEVLDIFETNSKIYDNFVLKMLEANNQDEFYIYSFVYDYLFTMQLDRSYFRLSNGELAKSYTEFLKYKDPVLYQYYLDIMSEERKTIYLKMILKLEDII